MPSTPTARLSSMSTRVTWAHVNTSAPSASEGERVLAPIREAIYESLATHDVSHPTTGKLTLGNMALYVMAFRQGQQAFQSILSAIGGMYEDNLYMSNLFAYLDGLEARPARQRAYTRTE